MRRRANELRATGWAAALGVLGLLGCAPPLASAAGEALAPEEVVDSLHRALVETANAETPLGREERFEKLEPIVSATHDFPYIAALTIRRQWRDLEPAQRDAFVDAFRRLSVMTYATRFASVRAGTFTILGREDAGSGRVEVRALIEPVDAEPVPLDYLLHDDGSGWRIVNILADGVSDLALKRAEYQRALENGTIEELIADLHERAAAL